MAHPVGRSVTCTGGPRAPPPAAASYAALRPLSSPVARQQLINSAADAAAAAGGRPAAAAAARRSGFRAAAAAAAPYEQQPALPPSGAVARFVDAFNARSIDGMADCLAQAVVYTHLSHATPYVGKQVRCSAEQQSVENWRGWERHAADMTQSAALVRGPCCTPTIAPPSPPPRRCAARWPPWSAAPLPTGGWRWTMPAAAAAPSRWCSTWQTARAAPCRSPAASPSTASTR